MGKPKAVVAAERINARVPGAKVTPHFGRIEDMPVEFYQQFTVIILGLDSLEARRYMNSIACSLLGESTARKLGVVGRNKETAGSFVPHRAPAWHAG